LVFRSIKRRGILISESDQIVVGVAFFSSQAFCR